METIPKRDVAAVVKFQHVAINKEVLSSGHYLVRSDNTGVVSVLNKGRSRSHETNQVLKNIYTSLAKHNLRISAVYVPSHNNVTDALSRGDIKGFLQGFPKAQFKALVPLPTHLFDFLILL